MKMILLCVSVFLASVAGAEETKRLTASPLCPAHLNLCTTLTDVISDYPQGYKGKLQVRRDSRGVVMGFDYSDNFDGDRVTPGQTYHQVYDLNRIRNGGVLLQALGIPMLTLRAPDFSEYEGGRVRIDVKPSLLAPRRAIYFQYSNRRVDFRLEAGRELLDLDLMKVTVLMSGGTPMGIRLIDFLLEDRIVHTVRF